jgi:caffeoyl-CoA O-methyltransferase
MEAKFIALTEQLNDYVIAHSGAVNDDILNDLRARTEQLGGISGMLISREQGTFLTLLAMGAHSALEIGTFTGYSALCIARGLAPGGKLMCLDVSDEWTRIAREHWQIGGVAERIELRLGPAADTLRALIQGTDATFDFVFIDADKSNYDVYYELVLPRVRPGGYIIFDNMLWHGKVVDESAQDADTLAIRALNDKLVADSRVVSVLLPVGDGFHICRKLP